MENIPVDNSGQIDRRQALKWIGAAAAAAAIFPHASAQDKLPRPAAPVDKRIGWDPVLNKNYVPGDLWPLTLTPKQRKAAASLTDLILPPDNPGDKLPSQLGVQEFIDEWISSPYDETSKDRPVITEGLDWLDAEAQRRFQKDFADLAEPQKCAIADDICGKTAVKRSSSPPRTSSAASVISPPAGTTPRRKVGKMSATWATSRPSTSTDRRLRP
ncbi:hypothetical protein EMGBS6_14940 [Opitutia bacterium]|nr:hypothetical protein EMGBS6_14940 [Opitutae bacterium]